MGVVLVVVLAVVVVVQRSKGPLEALDVIFFDESKGGGGEGLHRLKEKIGVFLM